MASSRSITYANGSTNVDDQQQQNRKTTLVKPEETIVGNTHCHKDPVTQPPSIMKKETNTDTIPWISQYPNFYPQAISSPLPQQEKENGPSEQEQHLEDTVLLEVSELHVEHEGKIKLILEHETLDTETESTYVINLPMKYFSDAINSLHINVASGCQYELLLPSPISNHDIHLSIPNKNIPLWYSLLHSHRGCYIRLDTLHGMRQGKLLHFEVPPYSPKVIPIATVVLDEGNSIMGVHSFDISYPPPFSFITDDMTKSDPNQRETKPVKLKILNNCKRCKFNISYNVPSGGFNPSFDITYKLQSAESLELTGREKKWVQLHGLVKFPNPTWFDLKEVKLRLIVLLEGQFKKDLCHTYEDFLDDDDTNLVKLSKQQENFQTNYYTADDENESNIGCLNLNLNLSDNEQVASLISAVQSSPNNNPLSAILDSLNPDKKENEDNDSVVSDTSYMSDSTEGESKTPRARLEYSIPDTISLPRGKSIELSFITTKIEMQLMPSLPTEIFENDEVDFCHDQISAGIELRLFNKEILPPGRLHLHFKNFVNEPLKYGWITWAKPFNVTRVTPPTTAYWEKSINTSWKRQFDKDRSFENECCIFQNVLFYRRRMKGTYVFKINSHEPEDIACLLSFKSYIPRDQISKYKPQVQKFRSIFDVCNQHVTGEELEFNEADKDCINDSYKSKSIFLSLKKYERCVIVITEKYELELEQRIDRNFYLEDVLHLKDEGIVNESITKFLLRTRKEIAKENALRTVHSLLNREIRQELDKTSFEEENSEDIEDNISKDTYDEKTTNEYKEDKFRSIVNKKQRKLLELSDLADEITEGSAISFKKVQHALSDAEKIYFRSDFSERKSNDCESQVQAKIKELEETMDLVSRAINETEDTQRQIKRGLSDSM